MEGQNSLTPEEVFDKDIGESVSKRKLLGRGLLVASCAIVLLMGIIFLISLLYSENGSFTVRAGKMDGMESAISLSETEGFANPTEKLSGIPINGMEDTTYDWLPFDELDSIPGSHNGEKYIAYTFYVRNSIEKAIDYEFSLNVLKATKHVDEAVRVMIYKNGTPTVYAKPAKDGGTEKIPSEIVNFESDNVVVTENVVKMKPGEIIRYSVIIWLEGEDPQDNNDILKGVMKMEINLKQTKVYEE